MKPEFKSVSMFEGQTITSAGTVFGAIDTIGFDHLAVDLQAGTADAAVTAMSQLRLSENDTLHTAHTSGDAITACVGAAATSTSAGFVLPAVSSSVANIYRFNIDLRGRKRYIGIDLDIAKQTVGVACNALLFRSEKGPAMETVVTSVAGARLIVST